MRTIALTILVLLIFSTCSFQDKSGNQDINPVVVAAENNNSRLFSKGGRADMIEELYQGQLEKSGQLKRLHDRIINIHGQIEDSTDRFDDFDNNNTRYYSSAKSKISGIKDSIIRQTLIELIKNSDSVYRQKIARHKELMHLADSTRTTINDLHEMYKIVSTLSTIHSYQKDELPSIEPLNGLNKDLNKIKSSLDSAIKKQ